MKKKTRRRANGEGTIHVLKDGRIQGRLELPRAPGSNRRIRKVVYGASKTEVQQKLAQLRTELNKGVLVSDASRTVNDLLDAWSASQFAGLRPMTRRSYQLHVDKYLRPGLGALPLVKVSAQTINDFLKRLQTTKRLKPGENDLDGSGMRAVSATDATKRYVRRVLRIAWRFALAHDWVVKDVVALSTPPKVEKKEKQPLTAVELRAVLAAAGGDRLTPLVQLAAMTGIRIGELCGLRWRNVDLEQGTLHIVEQLQRLRTSEVEPSEGERLFRSWFLTPPKSKASRRSVSLPSSCLSALRAVRVRQIHEQATAGEKWNALDLVFASSSGAPLDGGKVRRFFRKVSIEAGVQPRRFHDTRHTATTLMLEEGVAPHVAQAILGHTDVRTTLANYAHATPTQVSDAASRMDLLLAGAGEGPRAGDSSEKREKPVASSAP